MDAQLRTCEICRGKDFASLFEKADHRFVRCIECGLEKIDPPPTDETLAAIYGRHYYDAWGLEQDGESVAQLKKGTFGYVLDALPVRRGKLLDCGAATGFLLAVAKERGFEPYGIELSEFGADAIARKFGPGRSFRGEMEEASFPDVGDGGFDAITMCDYIEHERFARRVLEKAKPLLAKVGVIALTTPDTESLTRKVLTSGWSHYKVEHLHYFGRATLTRMLNELGFHDVTFKPLWKRLSTPAMSCARAAMLSGPSPSISAPSPFFHNARPIASAGRTKTAS